MRRWTCIVAEEVAGWGSAPASAWDWNGEASARGREIRDVRGCTVPEAWFTSSKAWKCRNSIVSCVARGMLIFCSSRDDRMQGVSDRRLLAFAKSVVPKIPSRDGLDSFPNSQLPAWPISRPHVITIPARTVFPSREQWFRIISLITRRARLLMRTPGLPARLSVH